MTIYEEIEEKEEEAKTQAESKSALSGEKEYYHIRVDAFREVLELFDKRERPEQFNEFYYEEDVADFLPPEHKK